MELFLSRWQIRYVKVIGGWILVDEELAPRFDQPEYIEDTVTTINEM